MSRVKLPSELSSDIAAIKSKRKENATTQIKINEYNDKINAGTLGDDEKTVVANLYKSGIEVCQKEES